MRFSSDRAFLSKNGLFGCTTTIYGKQFDPATSLRTLCAYRDGDLNEFDDKHHGLMLLHR